MKNFILALLAVSQFNSLSAQAADPAYLPKTDIKLFCTGITASDGGEMKFSIVTKQTSEQKYETTIVIGGREIISTVPLRYKSNGRYGGFYKFKSTTYLTEFYLERKFRTSTNFYETKKRRDYFTSSGVDGKVNGYEFKSIECDDSELFDDDSKPVPLLCDC